MSCGLYEVETSMDTVVNSFLAVNTIFLFEIGVETRLNIFQDGFPAGNEKGQF